MDYESWYQQHLQRFSPGADGWGKACCPIHDDSNPSLGCSLKTGKIRCWGCGYEGDVWDLASRIGAPAPPRPNGRRETKDKENKVEAEYIYNDRDGREFLKVVRYKGKDFRPFHKTPGGWKIGMTRKDGTRVLPPPYHLDRIAQNPQAVIWWVEGEKDADNGASLGLLTTTTPAGSSSFAKVDPDALALLAGREVIVLPDNDEPGRKYARMVSEKLLELGCKVRILELPGLKEGGDLSDWLKRRNNAKTQLLELATALEPLGPGETKPPGIPVIVVNARELRDVTSDALRALLQANQPEPEVYQRAGMLVRLRVPDDPGDLPGIEPLEPNSATGILARCADWRRETYRKDELISTPVFPRREVVQDILSLGRWPGIPLIDRIVQVPIFDRDGLLVDRPGYNEATRTFYHPPDWCRVPEVPEEPGEEQLQGALELLQEEMLGDFPFLDPASRANALSALLVPFVRDIIGGPSPLYLIEAPSAGTGKSLLANLLAVPAVGTQIHVLTESTQEDDWRKRLTSTLLDGPGVVLLDNLRWELNSGQLASALTSETWTDRILGSTKNVRIRIQCLWLATGNNLKISDEMARRCVWIRLDARMDRPWKRHGFRHSRILEWAQHNRGRLIHAVLVLVTNWVQRGMPEGTESLGSYEGWARACGGILQAAGIQDLLANAEELQERANEEISLWSEFIRAWSERFGSQLVTTGDLFGLVEDQDLLLGIVSGVTERSRKTKFAWALKSMRDRVVSGKLITSPPGGGKTSHYRLMVAGRDGEPQRLDDVPQDDHGELFPPLDTSDEALTRFLLGD